MTPPPMSEAEFLTAPIELVRSLVPATVVLGIGGTRRAASLAGIDPNSDAYAAWIWHQQTQFLAHVSHLGFKHICLTAIRPSQLGETGRYRERLLDWATTSFIGPDALADYAQQQWRIRLVGGQDIPELHHIATTLINAATPAAWTSTIWFHVFTTTDAPLRWIIGAAQQGAQTPAEVTQAIYGEVVPPAQLFISFGNPIMAGDIVPPVLMHSDVQCYWYQQPGYSLNEQQLRRILYDAIYQRNTRQVDRSLRYQNVANHRTYWEAHPLFGLGVQVDGCWYPRPPHHH